MTGYSREELLKMNTADMDVAETAEETARNVGKLFETGSHRFETRKRRNDCSIKIVETSSNYSKLDGGRIYSFLRDITERKQVEAELHIAAIAFESQDGMIVTDANSVILRVNRLLKFAPTYGLHTFL